MGLRRKKEIWITNISKRNVMLGDIRFCIPKGKSYNLLSKNFDLSEEDIIKSCESGSIFKKRDKIKVRHKAPEVFKNEMPIEEYRNVPFWLASSGVRFENVAEQPKFDELNFSDEDFAAEMASEDDDDEDV